MMAAGLPLLACWATWDFAHKIQTGEMSLGYALVTLGFYWLFAAVSLAVGTREPITSLAVDGNDFVLRRRWLYRRREDRFPITTTNRPRMRFERDDEGLDAYFVEIREPRGQAVTIGRRVIAADAERDIYEMNRLIDGRTGR